MQDEAAGRGWWREMSRYQWLVLFVAWLGWVFDIMDTALFNFAKVPMLTEMLGGEAQYKARGPEIEGLLQMVLIVGWAIGGFIFGILADRWGRTRTLILTIAIYCAFTALTGLCQTPEQVAVVRFLTALGIGGEWAAGAALVAEVLPNRARAAGAAILQTAAAVGPVLAATFNLALAGQSWRWLFYVGVAPALITIVIRAFIKEPEHRIEQAKRTTVGEMLTSIFAHPKWTYHVIIAVLVGTVGVAGAGIGPFWLPNLVKEASEGLAAEVVKERTSYATYMLHIGTFLGVFFFPWLATRIGRKWALFVGFVCSPIAIFTALHGDFTYERLMLMAPLLSFFAIGLSAIFGLYFPELFPTRIRATGAGLGYNVARILQAPFPWIVGLLIIDTKSPTHGLTLAALVYVVGILVVLAAPETRGKPLPEDE